MENKQYLTFRWHEQQYAIEAPLVQELFPLPEITLIPKAPIELIGMLNLRGQLLPMMHLDLIQGNSLKGCKFSDYVITVQWEGLHFGLVVHQVLEVLELNPENITTEIQDELLSNINPVFISGFAQVENEQILLLNIKTLMSESDDLLALIWDAQTQLDIIATSPTNALEDSAQIVPNQDKSHEQKQSVNKEEFNELLQPPKEIQEIQNHNAIPSFYDLYFPNATPEERNIFRQRADHLKSPLENVQVINDIIPLAVIGFGNEYFGLDLELVREFIDITNLTPIPGCPSHIVGNMNLRGEIVTLVDIRKVLNLPLAPIKIDSQAVVVQVNDIVAGLPVDQVLEMVYLNSDDMTLPPNISCDLGESYIRGAAVLEEKNLKILDMVKLFTQGELVVNEEA
ncbi:chemotaxis protein CheW [Allocoleopsis franciscana]|uniref:Chemotaxis signal transduction protein n=1 Tax=Allocoleopsis franciscana PCC 7113 TaxID=1173027 RepID=K9WDM4_9CYAN|nr:chemotaxis protein CheW [Allocoleopsis franciscana]AFZ18495.1 chemotaxis signal transduction protein [Allocoleopsis franciscana PCC 7113]